MLEGQAQTFAVTQYLLYFCQISEPIQWNCELFDPRKTTLKRKKYVVENEKS